jgi:putative transposase
VVIETVRYTYRLRPGGRGEVALPAQWNRCRFFWNEAVHLQETGQRPNFAGLCRLLTGARGRLVWLCEGCQVAGQQVLAT